MLGGTRAGKLNLGQACGHTQCAHGDNKLSMHCECRTHWYPETVVVVDRTRHKPGNPVAEVWKGIGLLADTRLDQWPGHRQCRPDIS